MQKTLPSLATFLAAVLATGIVAGQNREPRFTAPERPKRPEAHAPQDDTSDRLPLAEPQPADRLMADMLASIRGHDSISARIRQRIDVLDQQLVGTGLYQQQGRGEDQKLRLELKIQVADQTTSLQQICDGSYLWVHQDLLNKTTLTRIDVRRVREAVFDRGGRRSRFQQIQLALGGLPKLLEELDRDFEFRIVQQDRLDGVPVWVIRGTWRPEALAATYPDPKAKPAGQGGAPIGKLPAHAPDVMVLLVGRDDLFPYRIEFRRRIEPDNTTPDRTDETRALVIMEWFELALDTPIDERQFIYRPGDVKHVDGTEKLLIQMGLLEEEPPGERK